MSSTLQATVRASCILGQLAPVASSCTCSSGCLHSQPTSASLGQTPRQFIRQEIRGRVGVIYLNRPKAMNALNDALMAEVGAAVVECENSGVIGCIVLTGDGKAFAAGVRLSTENTFGHCSMH